MNEAVLKEKLYKKVVPVVAVKSIAHAKAIGDFLVEKGYGSVEVTFRTSVAAEAVRYLKDHYDLLVGAGTVYDRETAAIAVRSGADFIVSPGFSKETVTYCDDNGVPVIPGVETAGEIIQAIACGKTFLKFFPAEAAGGISKLKALHAPFQNMTFMPTGGIDASNVNGYLSLDFVLCCGGSYIVPKSLEHSCGTQE